MKQKLTDWYPPHIKPVRVGWYHTGEGDCSPAEAEGHQNCWWNGLAWFLYPGVEYALFYQNRWWRGLAEQQKKEE